MERPTRTEPGSRTGAPRTGRPRGYADAPPVAADVERRRPRWADPDQMPRGMLILRRVLLWVAPVVLLSVLAAIVLHVRLLQGPISLKVLAGPIERGITAELEGLSAHVGDARLRRSATGDYNLELVNLRLNEKDGSVVAQAPVAAVSLDMWRLPLLQVLPRRVELIDPRVAVTYTERDGLSLSFTEPPETVEDAQTPAPQSKPDVEPSPADAPKALAETPSAIQNLDLARVISEYAQRARHREDVTASLTQLGLRNAVVDVDYEGRRSSWKVEELSVDLDHRQRRSLISGAARIASERGPWTLSLLTEDSEKAGTLTLRASVRDLVPSTLGQSIPKLDLLKALQMPIAGDATLRFKTAGEITSADFGVEVGRGLIDFGPAMAHPVLIDAGLFKFNYDAATQRVAMAPSTARWGDSSVTLTGLAAYQGERSSWTFDVRSVSGALAAEEFKVAPINLDEFLVTGRFTPANHRIEFGNISVHAGGSGMQLAGEILMGDAPAAGARIEGRFGPANAGLVKAFWPRMMAPRARQWFGEHLTEGLLQTGTLQFRSGTFASPGAPLNRVGVPENVALDVAGESVSLLPLQGASPLRAPVVTATVRDRALTITAPEALIATATGGGVPLKQGQFSVSDIDAPIADAEMAFKTQAGLAAALDAAGQMKLLKTENFAIPVDKIQGKVEGDFVIRLPLLPELEADTIKVTGKAKITDVKSKEKLGLVDLQSGAIDIMLAPAEATAKGELILNGVPAKVDWRRQTPEGAPAVTSPLTITATLDNSDRRQLGIDVSDFIDGDVPVSVALGPPEQVPPVIKVAADLTPADLSISPLAWKKPRGRPAKLEFDVVQGTVYKTDLKNFKISGETIAAEGSVSLSADQKVQQFDFPGVSLNTVSRLQLAGKRGARDIMDVQVKGTTYDGREFFRSLFTSGTSAKPKAAAAKGGVDVTANFDTVLGYSDASLRNFSMRLSKRGDELTALDARGKFDGGKALIAILQAETNGNRKIIADTTDAGQSLKLVGFYPNMQGGRGRIDLFLDGPDSQQTSGVLIIEDFKVLGDPIVSEVVSSAAGDGPAIGAAPYGKRKVVREVFEFDRMRLPFNVGYGQFGIEDSYLRGPMLGATLRGKVDYSAQKVNLGGTYIPLQGLNNALGGIPVLGQILSGTKGEGIFGITFAVQGSMANPQVVVNPLSLVAPGIFREMFAISDPNTTVQPRAPSSGDVPVNKRVRASSSGGSYQGPEEVDGWSSDTVVPTKKN